MPDTKLEALKKQFNKILERLEEVLEKEKNKVNRDSAIKRFELSFDVTWKLLKSYLQEEEGIYCASPKECFRQAYKTGVIDYDDRWIEMTEERNSAVHTYSESFANALYEKLPEYLKCLQQLKKRI
jgi:nucleotidyltransferase substrate binding protein (TIGR01987 family)